MSQEECLNYLKKIKDWQSSKDVKENLKTGRASVSTSLKKLFEKGEVDREERRMDNHYIYFWRIK